MPWNDLAFPPNSVLTSSQMTGLQQNFAALATGAPGAPRLAIDDVSSLATVHASSGLSAPGVSSLGTVEVAGSFTRGGGVARTLVQEVWVSLTGSHGIGNALATYSYYLVGSITPAFGDSVLTVEAQMAWRHYGLAFAPGEWLVHLTRDAVQLSPSSAYPDRLGSYSNYSLSSFAFQSALTYREPSPGAGTPFEYRVWLTPNTSDPGSTGFTRRTMLVREWR